MKNKIDLEAAWEEALKIWGFNIWLSIPEFNEELEVKEKTSMNDLIAFTDLLTRQVTVNTSAITKFGIEGSITEIMAHEIGHHFKYPSTMQEAAALQVIQERMLPGISAPMFINLFEDLLINENIGNDPDNEKERRQKLADIYEKCLLITAQSGNSSLVGYVFLFYLAVYEKLWNVKIITNGQRDRLRKFSSGYQQEAESVAKNLFYKPGVYHKFVYFCAKFAKYLTEDAKNSGSLVFVPAGTCGRKYDPDTDDINSVMSGAISEAIDEAIDGVSKEIESEQNKVNKPPKPKQEKTKQQENLDIINQLSKNRPGHDAAAFKKVLVSKHYQRLVNENILKLPATIKAQERTIPSVLEDWEWGERIGAIDWVGTVNTQGHLAGIKPQQRDLIVDDGAPEYFDVPAIEIYVDTSGSMPNPQNSVNAMTLAAMILAASAIRHKGIVKSIIYSSGPYKVSEWMRDELKSNEELLYYIGGGTDFPFDYLEKSCKEDKNVVRVIISDQDFLYNLAGDTYYSKKSFNPREVLMRSIEESKLLVCMLHLDKEYGKKEFAKESTREKFRLTTVQDLNAYAKAAAELAAVLFDGYVKP
jgi:hypothetical protein